jgi:hypothetical protein
MTELPQDRALTLKEFKEKIAALPKEKDDCFIVFDPDISFDEDGMVENHGGSPRYVTAGFFVEYASDLDYKNDPPTTKTLVLYADVPVHQGLWISSTALDKDFTHATEE